MEYDLKKRDKRNVKNNTVTTAWSVLGFRIEEGSGQPTRVGLPTCWWVRD
jgi:hypothetical protein